MRYAAHAHTHHRASGAAKDRRAVFHSESTSPLDTERPVASTRTATCFPPAHRNHASTCVMRARKLKRMEKGGGRSSKRRRKEVADGMAQR